MQEHRNKHQKRHKDIGLLLHRTRKSEHDTR